MSMPKETEPELAAVDPGMDEAADEVRNILALFVKALKGYRLYLPNNRTLKGFVDSLHQALQSFLTQRADLCLRVTQTQILRDGVVVYENAAREESLAFRLFIHGVREIAFHKGVPLEELTDFLKVLHRAFDAKTSVDDLLTLLWEKDFAYVTFIVLDDFFEEGEQADFEEFVEEGQRADHTAGSVRATMRPLIDRLLARSGEGDDGPSPDIFDLTAEEIERLSGWLTEERNRDLVHTFLRILLQLLVSAEEQEAKEIFVVLDRLIEALFSEGRIKAAIRTVQELRGFALEPEGPAPLSGVVEQALQRIGGDRMVQLVERHYESTDELDRDLLTDFLVSLDETAVPSLVELLTRSETKEIAGRALLRMAPDHMATFALALKDPRPSIVIAVIRILGEIHDTRALGPLRAVLVSPDAAIRREAIRAVGQIGSEAAFPLLRDVLSDSEQDIRVAAVRALTALPDETIRRPLFDLARARDFSRRSYFEKKEILSALATAADPEVEDWIVGLARRRGWFCRKTKDELRSCAVAALSRLGTPASQETLRDCAQDRSPRVRQAALQALRS